MGREDDNYRGGGGAERGGEVRFEPAPYQSGGRPDLAKPVAPVKVEKPVVRGVYEAPEVISLTSSDPVQLYRNSISPNHPKAFESGKALSAMVRGFFVKLEIPVSSQMPILSVSKVGNIGVVVMRAAFLKYSPSIQVLKTFPNQLLDDVRVDLGFFEKTVMGEVMGTRREVSAQVAGVEELK